MKLPTKGIEKKLPFLATVENQSMEELVSIVKFSTRLLHGSGSFLSAIRLKVVITGSTAWRSARIVLKENLVSLR